jgi:hypothetical protein
MGFVSSWNFIELYHDRATGKKETKTKGSTNQTFPKNPVWLRSEQAHLQLISFSSRTMLDSRDAK